MQSEFASRRVRSSPTSPSAYSQLSSALSRLAETYGSSSWDTATIDISSRPFEEWLARRLQADRNAAEEPMKVRRSIGGTFGA